MSLRNYYRMLDERLVMVMQMGNARETAYWICDAMVDGEPSRELVYMVSWAVVDDGERVTAVRDSGDLDAWSKLCDQMVTKANRELRDMSEADRAHVRQQIATLGPCLDRGY